MRNPTLTEEALEETRAARERFALVGRLLETGNRDALSPETVQWYVRQADLYERALVETRRDLGEVLGYWSNVFIPLPDSGAPQ